MERSVIHNLLMRELRLLHSPVGIHFFFEKEELESFRAERTYHTPTRPLTFCQAELGARMEGITVLLEDSRLWCTDARCVFGSAGAERRCKREGEQKRDRFLQVHVSFFSLYFL